MEKIIKVLLVEDDQLDAMNILRTMDKLNILYQLQVAKNGEEAIKMLETHYRAEGLPDFVLIDINMPRMNGLEFLSTIRQTEDWRALKCFIITTSDEKVDKERAKKLGTSGYIIKPLKLSNTTSMDAFNLMIDLLNTKS
jgi:CheY-like chemotaxis protein